MSSLSRTALAERAARPWTRARGARLALALAVAGLAGPLAGSARAQEPAPRADAPAISGSLDRLHGVSVLRVRGTGAEMGFAHGYLLAERIVAAVDAVLAPGGFVPAAVYEARLRPLLGERADALAHQDEVAGIVRGVVARLGAERAVVRALGRPLGREEVLLLNVASDLRGLLCSSFSVWGAAAGGETVTGRNLDYHGPAAVMTEQLVLVFEPSAPGRRRWASIGWPGVIGCFTGVSEDGMSVLIHDTNGYRAGGGVGARVVPRGLALREVIERAPLDGAGPGAARLLAGGGFVAGGNVHISVPWREGGGDAAWVVEFDGAGDRAGGAQLRAAADGAPRPGALVCTNHFRVRREARPCDRYDAISAALAGHDGALALDRARGILSEVAFGVGRLTTVHSVVVYPNRRELFLGLADGEQNGAAREPARFAFDELFGARRAGF